MGKHCDKKRTHHKKRLVHSKCGKCDESSSSSSSSSSCTIPAPIVKKNFIFAYNTTGFTYPNNTNFSVVPFDTVGAADGWTLNIVSGASVFTVPKTSAYHITYTVTVQNSGLLTDGGLIVRAEEQNVDFRIHRNNFIVAGSNSWGTLNISDISENGYVNGSSNLVKPAFVEISNSVIVNLNAGDMISLNTAGSIYGSVSTLSLPTTANLLGLTGLEPAKIAIFEVA